MLKEISDAATNVYDSLGSGHTEIIYHRAMEVELRSRGLHIETKVPLPIYYRNFIIGYQEADLIVYKHIQDDCGIIVELKSVAYAPRDTERNQIASYLRTRGYNNAHGVLINFRQGRQGTHQTIDQEYFLIEGNIISRLPSEHDTQSNDTN